MSSFSSVIAIPLVWVLFLGLLLTDLAHADDIAVLYALDADWRELKADDAAVTRNLAGTSVHTIKIGTHTVHAVQMGAGNVETAVNTSRLLTKFACDKAVSIGPAGWLGEDQNEKCFVVNQIIAYQRGTWSPQGWHLAQGAIADLDRQPFEGATISNSPWSQWKGTSLASGEVFVANDNERNRIREETQADLVDMNSYGALLACRKANIPLLILKVRSDDADNKAAETFKAFIASYDGKLGREVRRWIQALPISPDLPDAYENIREKLR